MDDKHADKKPEVKRKEEAFFLGYPDLVTYLPMGHTL